MHVLKLRYLVFQYFTQFGRIMKKERKSTFSDQCAALWPVYKITKIYFYSNLALIFKEAESSVDPNDCALVIGVTYFLSSILGLVLKKHVGRRILLLASELGMAISQLAMGLYFYVLTSKLDIFFLRF